MGILKAIKKKQVINNLCMHKLKCENEKHSNNIKESDKGLS